MRKSKLWSLLLASSLLCICLVGVFFIGTQAESTAYNWYVDGVGNATDHYATVDAAMKAAKAKTWAKGDSLTIYVTTSGTATTFQSGTAGRGLFSVYTVFRADNTKLPITINGDDPTTTVVEQNSILFGNAPTWKPDGVVAFAATNDYTFKNMDLSTWGDTTYTFMGGSGEVVFDNVNFGTTQTMVITPSVGGWTFFTDWNPTRFNVNADADGLQPTGFTFIGTDYGKNIGTLSSRPINFGIANKGNAVNGLTIKNEMLRNKIVIGEGSDVAYVTHHNVATYPNLPAEPGESMIEVNGGNVTNLLGAAEISGYKGVGKKLITNVKSGTVENLLMGPGLSGTTYTGDIEIHWTGGTVTNYKSVKAGTVNGTVTNHVKGIDASGFTANGFNMSGAISGTIHNIYEDCTINAGRFLGVSGKVKNVINTLKGTLTTNQTNFYLGTNQEGITGNLTNNIACQFKAAAGAYFWCGSNGGTVTGTVTNNILPGADIEYLIGGCNGGNAAAVVNNMTGGTVKNFYAANGNNNKQTLASVTTNLLGGTVNTFVGATGDVAGGKITKVVNNIGLPNGDGTFTGNAWIKKFYGGATVEAISVGEIENNYYAGTIGAADRSDQKTWFADSGDYQGFGGSSVGKVGKIANNFHGGVFNVGYFYCGNVNKNATFDTAYALASGEARITNTLYGGHFARYCGGSKGGDAISVKNLVNGTSHGSITTREGAFYGGLGANENTDVYNEITGFAPVNISGNAGDFTANLSKLGTMVYGGNNNENVRAKSITNVVRNGVKISYLVGGCNSGLQPAKITNHIYDGVIGEFYGGNKNNSYSAEMTGIYNTVEKGTITTYIGGFKIVSTGLKIGEIENKILSGNIASFIGGHGTAYDSNDKGEIVTLTNTIESGSFTKEFIAGCKETSAALAAATEDAVFKIGKIINNVGSTSVETRPVFSCIFYGGCHKELPAKNENGAASYFRVDAITNDFGQVLVNNSVYLGNRYHTLGSISNTIAGLEVNGSTFSFGNNVGAFTGASYTVLRELNLNATVYADAASTACAIANDATFHVEIPDGAKITLQKGKVLNLLGASPAKGTHTVAAGKFELIQTDFWADGTVYLAVPEGTNLLDRVTVSGGTMGMVEIFADKVVGKSTLSLVEANLILSDRVALRIVYDKPVLSQYDPTLLTVLVNGACGKIELDPENECAVIVYGIGLPDFDKVITFGGYLPALSEDQDSIIELSDFAAKAVDEGEIYKAIADMGRVYVGKEAKYGLSYQEITKTSQMNAKPDTSALTITGKNLVMKDAIGFRYYGTLASGTTLSDVKVFVDGDDYTEFCSLSYADENKTEIIIDLFLGIRSMDTFLNIKITAGQTTALNYMDSCDAVAQAIINDQPDNAAAKAALAYIQTAGELSVGGAKK